MNHPTDQFWVDLYAGFEEATPLAFGYGDSEGLRDWILEVPQAGNSEHLVAAWALLLSRYVGESIVGIGTQNFDDPSPRPLRLEVDEDQSVASYLESIATQCDGQNISEETLRDVLGMKPDRPLYHCVVDVHAGIRGSGRQSDDALVRAKSHFERIAGGLAGGGGLVRDIRHLTDTELDQVLREWNPPPTSYPEVSVHALFERQVDAHPDATALVFDGHRWTYGELNAEANRLVRRLIGQEGVLPGQGVAIFLERGGRQIVSIFAVLKAGAAYIPLDTEFPGNRISQMLEDARPNLIVTQSKVLDGLVPPANSRLLVLDEIEGDLKLESADNPKVECSCDSLAYIMYTSGSTGRPKGVEVPHRGIIRLLFGVDYVPFGSDTVMLHMAAASFDASTLEIWGPLLHGGICVLSPSRVPTLGEIGDLIARNGVDILWMTAGLFNLAIEEAPEILRPVEYLITGGEALSCSHVEKALRALPDVQLINGYGPTENTTFSTTYAFDRDAFDPALPIPIGRAIGNSSCYILDHLMRPVPIGVPGELYVGGDGVARGYTNQPDLTAERFLADPFSCRSGARMYKTGDIAYWNRQGFIEFIGRADNQIKLRGFRIELLEVDAVLGAFPGVEQAATVLYEDDVRGKWLAGFVKVGDFARFPLKDLERFVREKLPEYMVPAAFVPLEEWSYTLSGKLDRQALPKPPEPVLASGFKPPQTRTQKVLAEVLLDLLKLDRVGIDHDFFELGGDSLKGVRLFHEIHHRFGRDLPLSMLTQSPTIRGLAGIIDDQRDPASTHSFRSLQVLQEGSPEEVPPLLLIHGGAGNVVVFREFVRNMGTDQPVYAFQWSGWDGLRGHRTLKDMATFYMEELLRYSPSETYRLGGHCVGGLIAIELARELQVAGIGIQGPIVVSDCPNLGSVEYNWFEPELTVAAKKDFDGMVEDLHFEDPANRGGFALGLKERIKSVPLVVPLVRWVRRIPALLHIRLGLALHGKVPIEHRALYASVSLVKAARRHKSSGYSGDILYFRSHSVFGRDLGLQGWWNDRFMGFGELCRGNFEGHVVGGKHDDPLGNPSTAEIVKKRFNKWKPEGGVVHGAL
ncbi:MAG: amino acid adenylation domain-containing protein [Verrucomicrobiota bacterium]